MTPQEAPPPTCRHQLMTKCFPSCWWQQEKVQHHPVTHTWALQPGCPRCINPPPPRRPIDGPASVNLHCTYVTFLKRRRPRSQVINPARGNWMLIGETIDHKPAWIVRSNIDDSSHIDKRPRRMRARETIATRPHPFIIVMIGCLRRQRVLSARLNVLVQCLLGGRIHLSFHFHSALASSHTATFTPRRGTVLHETGCVNWKNYIRLYVLVAKIHLVPASSEPARYSAHLEAAS